MKAVKDGLQLLREGVCAARYGAHVIADSPYRGRKPWCCQFCGDFILISQVERHTRVVLLSFNKTESPTTPEIYRVTLYGPHKFPQFYGDHYYTKLSIPREVRHALAEFWADLDMPD